ncbi:MAG TPA: CvpA family protein [Chitinophagaceae bacterium]|nr:CvpA family protein [Chitinophagaceae bacterium]HNF72097.1 CvpA family protein [Chitinophagaceae bacterium]
MIIDLIGGILILLAFIRGWSKGLLWAICSLLAFILAFWVAMQWGDRLADILFTSVSATSKYAGMLGFVLVFILVLMGCRLVVRAMEQVLEKLWLGWLNSLLGAILYTSVFWLLAGLFCWLGARSGLLKKEQQESSRLYPVFYSTTAQVWTLVTAKKDWPFIKTEAANKEKE